VGTDPETSREVELFNPREHRWADHFAWPLTEPELIGRATVATLDLNARRQVEIRRWLAEIGKHPPV
jgi:hypothetical protein